MKILRFLRRRKWEVTDESGPIVGGVETVVMRKGKRIRYVDPRSMQ